MNTYDFFIRIISDFINNVKTDYCKYIDCDLSSLCYLASINNVSGIVYHQLKHCNIDNDILESLKNVFLIDCIDSLKKDAAISDINRLLNFNHIEHIFLKGSFLRKLYPVPELRTMGDIDILVNSKHKNIIGSVLSEEGYIYDPTYSYSNVFDFKKNGMLFEIHTEAVYNNFNEDIDILPYFSDSFEHSTKISEYEYALDNEYNFIYLIAHLAKHYYSGGAGIRMFMDIALFIDKYGYKMDINYIKEQIIEINLHKFLCFTNTLCNKWFGTEQYFDDYDIAENFMHEVKTYILNGGLFGDNNDRYANIMLTHISCKKYNISRIKGMVSYIFPSDAYMRTWSKWYEKMPIIFLPLSWLHRAIYFIFVRKKKVGHRIKNVIKESKNLKERYLFLKQSGLVE